jgi:hypothetical protein
VSDTDSEAPAGGGELEAYRLGRTYAMLPIAMVPEACRHVPAGPVTFVVEGRRLTDEAILGSAVAQGTTDVVEGPTGVDDGGMTVHVLGAADRLEHLRFDCFDQQPHYHYIDNVTGSNTVVRIDTHAEGDPTAWSLARLRERLPEMLAHAGVPDLAEQVRAAPAAVARGIDQVERLLG